MSFSCTSQSKRLSHKYALTNWNMHTTFVHNQFLDEQQQKHISTRAIWIFARRYISKNSVVCVCVFDCTEWVLEEDFPAFHTYSRIRCCICGDMEYKFLLACMPCVRSLNMWLSCASLFAVRFITYIIYSGFTYKSSWIPFWVFNHGSLSYNQSDQRSQWKEKKKQKLNFSLCKLT